MLQDLKAQLEELKQRIKKVRGHLQLDEKKEQIKELGEKAGAPDFWNDSGSAQKTLQELKELENQAKSWESLNARIEDMLTLAQVGIEEKDESVEKEIISEVSTLIKEIETFEVSTLLTGKHDHHNAILNINAGAGGTDAQDWTEILLRMYLRWIESKGYESEIVEISPGEEAGLKSVTLTVEGLNAYGYLKAERGIHRLVRLSPFDAARRRHTSFAAVEVIPEVEAEKELKIDPKDLRIDTFRSSGAGGQHVNKTDSAVRITHLPTGIVAQSQKDRSQHSNREAAMRILISRLRERMEREHKEKIEELRGKQKEIAWGSQIRSYVFHPYNLVKDHRTGWETSNVQKTIDGDLDQFIEIYLRKKG